MSGLTLTNQRRASGQHLQPTGALLSTCGPRAVPNPQALDIFLCMAVPLANGLAYAPFEHSTTSASYQADPRHRRPPTTRSSPSAPTIPCRPRSPAMRRRCGTRPRFPRWSGVTEQRRLSIFVRRQQADAGGDLDHMEVAGPRRRPPAPVSISATSASLCCSWRPCR